MLFHLQILPHSDYMTHISHCRYNVVFMFLTYFLPIGSMTFTYARVGLELWGSQSIGECTQRQLDNIKSKRKVSWQSKWKRKRQTTTTTTFACYWGAWHENVMSSFLCINWRRNKLSYKLFSSLTSSYAKQQILLSPLSSSLGQRTYLKTRVYLFKENKIFIASLLQFA